MFLGKTSPKNNTKIVIITVDTTTGKIDYFTENIDIFTIGDLAAADETSLKTRIGKNGVTLRRMARGEDCEPVRAYYNHIKPKSIGHSATAEKDLTEENEIFAAFLGFSEGISNKLKQENLLANTIVISVLTNNFESREYRTGLSSPTDISMTIAKKAMELFKKNNCLSVPLRAVGVRVVNLVDNANAMQLNLIEDITGGIDNEIEDNILKIRKKYGKNSLKRAVCMNNKAIPSSPGFKK